MRLNILAARLLSVAVLGLPLTARAADMDYRAPPYDPYARSESPYDDPRYRDLYEDPPRAPRYAEPRYEDERPLPRSYKDDGYLEPMPVPPRFSEGPRSTPPGCLPRREVHERLVSSGWGDFHDIDLRGPLAHLKARRPSGRLFELTIDRCTGRIVESQQLSGPEPRPYAWRTSPPPHYDRRY